MVDEIQAYFKHDIPGAPHLGAKLACDAGSGPFEAALMPSLAQRRFLPCLLTCTATLPAMPPHLHSHASCHASLPAQQLPSLASHICTAAPPATHPHLHSISPLLLVPQKCPTTMRTSLWQCSRRRV